MPWIDILPSAPPGVPAGCFSSISPSGLKMTNMI